MKTTLITLLVVAAACGVAVAGDTFPAITTTDGATYTHITAQRADPDGLYLEFTPAGGGMGSTKVKFNRLPADLQKQYGYDTDAAKQYEAGTAKAALNYQAWADQHEAATQKARSEAAARDLQEEALAVQRQQNQLAAQAQQVPVQVMGNPYSFGWQLYGGTVFTRPAPRNTWTGTIFNGIVPQSTLFTPIGFNPTKTQVITAAPRAPSRAPSQNRR